MNNLTAPVGQLGQYIPPKNWKDLTVEEKVERVREQIKYLQNNISRCSGLINDLGNDFKNHGHLEGKVVKDIKTHNEGLSSSAKMANPEAEIKGEVYF